MTAACLPHCGPPIKPANEQTGGSGRLPVDRGLLVTKSSPSILRTGAGMPGDNNDFADMDRRAEILNNENQVKGRDETERRAALADYGIFEMPDEAVFDDLVSLAAQLCGTTSAAIIFLDDERQWIKASLNLDDHSRACAAALCARAMVNAPALVIENLATDPQSEQLSGFYAAALLHTPQGLPLGALCVLDAVPRPFSEQQLAQLQTLARQVMALLELRRGQFRVNRTEGCAHIRNVVDRASQALLEAEQRVSLANEIASIGVWEYDLEQNVLHWDTQLKALAGIAADEPELSVKEFLARVHDDDRQALLGAFRSALEGQGDGELNLDYRVYDAASDQFRWLTNRGRRLQGPDGKIRLLGTAREITAERNAALKLLRMNTLLEEQIRDRKLTEQRQTLLMELGDLLRGQPDSVTIITAVVQTLGTTLSVTRAAFLSINPGGHYATVERYWSGGALGDHGERMCFADYGDFIYDLQNDELVVVEDVQHDTRTAAQAAALRLRHIQSLVCVPLQEQGRLSAALILLQDRPRQWAEEDISFIREVADRAWTADERIRAERALRASEEQFRTLADNMSQFAWMADPTGHIYWYNKRWYDYTGTTYEAMRALSWRAVNHPDHHERVSASMRRAVAIGSIWEETFPLRGKDGQYRWFLSRALPIRDDFGQVTHWFGTNTDITAQVTAEEALRELNDNLERRVAERTRELAEINHLLHLEMGERERAEETLRHAQKMEAIGQLTGGLAHDFNNMLSGVLGALELIQRRVASGRVNDLDRYVDAATTSANRAAALTHRLLAFARRQSLDPKPVDVNRLVLSMEDMLRRTMAEHITFETRLQADPWLAYTDAHQLENALLNLVINARDAMSEGGRLIIQTGCVQIDDTQHDHLEPGDYITLSVADNGCGMPAEVIAKAFDPFFTTKPIGQGTGLGLSMVYGFVKQTGGHVRIDSTPGQGTLITLFLPRNQAQVEAPEVQDRPALETQGACIGETVLVVEDEVAVRMLVIEVLEELGYRVLEALDGTTALPYLQGDQRIDLLLSDIGLPGINGRQLAEIARQLRPQLKVLFITGYAPDAGVRDEFLAPGMDMLSKPFSIDTLGARVRELIGRNG
ncbi:PAS domain-containing protein [Pseudomonas stutzeri]|nr:PAS domain-containing protein [Stutzerimonas stutzeri]